MGEVGRNFLGRAEKFFAAGEIDDNSVSKIVFVLFLSILDARRNGPRAIEQRRVCGYFFGKRAPAPFDSAERFRLHLGHSGFDAKLPRRVIYGKNFRQRRRADKYPDRLVSQLRLHAHHCLHGKIRNEKACELHSSFP